MRKARRLQVDLQKGMNRRWLEIAREENQIKAADKLAKLRKKKKADAMLAEREKGAK